MLRFILILIYLGIVMPAAQGQDYHVNQIPIQLFKNAKVVVRSQNTEVEIVSLEKMTVQRTYVLTILNQAGESHNYTLSRNSELSKCQHISGKLYDREGKLLRKNDKAEVKKYSGNDTEEFSDGTTSTLMLTHSEYPYTVEYVVKEDFKSLIFVPDWYVQDEGMAVQFSRYKVSYPKQIGMQARLIGLDVKPQVSAVDQEIESWSGEVMNLPAPIREPMTKTVGPVMAYACFTPKMMKIKDFESKTDNWQAFGKLFYQLNHQRDELSPGMVGIVRNMVKHVSGNREKIDILYNYLKDNYRYVSVQIAEGGWQTYPASYVEQKRYGDCKALSNFMKAMLKGIGIDAHLCLIEADEDNYIPALQENLPPFNAFNHMILYIPSEDLWLECTSNALPTGYLGGFTQNRDALVLTPAGGVLKRTPTENEKNSVQDNYTKVSLQDPLGNARIESIQRLKGRYAEHWYRIQVSENELKKRNEFAARWLNLVPNEFLGLNIHTDKKNPQAEISIDLAAKYGSKFGSRMNIPLHKTNPFKHNLSADSSRTQPIWNEKAFTWRDSVLIQLPVDFQFEAIPNASEFSSQFGSYRKVFERKSDQVLLCFRELIMLPIDVPASSFADLLAWYNKVQTADLESVVAVQSKRP